MAIGSRRSRIVRSLVKLVFASLLVLGVAAIPSSAAADPNYPGFPKMRGGGWDGPKASGINEVSTAKQWVQLPPMYNLVWAYQPSKFEDPGCRRGGDYETTQEFPASLFIISTDDRAPEPSGYVGPFAVRTAAFGSIPVEAQVLIGQERDDENFPVGIEFSQSRNTFCPGSGPHAGSDEQEKEYTGIGTTASVHITISELKVDGVDVNLQDGCRPSESSTLELGSPSYYSLDPDHKDGDRPIPDNRFTTPYFDILAGGLLTGNVDVGPFVNCRTAAGEDLSNLLTATVSGSDNEVRIRSQGLDIHARACAQDRSKCVDPLPSIPLPERDEG